MDWNPTCLRPSSPSSRKSGSKSNPTEMARAGLVKWAPLESHYPYDTFIVGLRYS